MNDITDETIARAVQKGDTEQFGVLMERYEEKLLRYGKRFLKDPDKITDAVQDVFIKCYQNIQSFDTDQRFSPWIYRIAHNTFINIIRENKKSPFHLFDFDTLVSHPTYSDPAVGEKEFETMRALLEKNMGELSPQYQEILILYYLEELPYKDIADVLRIPVSTVGVRLHRAKEQLKKHFILPEEYA
ncbi:MAG TPA: RNA polymerase sigma factor [Candidatus Paceibacterota bacterium]|jgi:RNA polymerase sigma-70 factor (ECF subfamily)|nr:RNA polymerase sigma factor [Candidatus Paceibacterota bacterium]